MHLIYYGRNVLDLHGLSTGVSLAIIVGAGYGLVQLVVDLGRKLGITARPITPVWEPRRRKREDQ